MNEYRLWVNEERTVLLRIWASGQVEVATRDSPEHTWGPPVHLEEEDTGYVSAGKGGITIDGRGGST
jgi:hypothetical protein